jgi:diketogulonate reductase-like aldo/keto reductase
MAELQKQGKVSSIGVSNFTVKHLEQALLAGVQIVNNQVEFHPGLFQKELLDYCNKQNISLTAYSPIAQGNILQDAMLKEIAKKYGKTTAQVCLRWAIEKNIIAIPKASSKEHLLENMQLFDWKLENKDTEKIDSMGNSNRLIKPFFARF